MFSWIFENIYSNESKTENNKISFSVEIKDLMLDKIKRDDKKFNFKYISF